MSSAQIICTQVVPVLDRVLITMSPLRNGKPCQRALSSSAEVYRATSAGTRRAYVRRGRSGGIAARGAELSQSLEQARDFRAGNLSAVAGIKHQAAHCDVEGRIEGHQPAVRLALPGDVCGTGLGINR